MMKSRHFSCGVLLAVVAVFATPIGRQGVQAATSDSDRAKEQELIAVLKSDAPPQDKAIPCKQLAIYGTKDAVPALAALLPDRELSSWARIALEAIPDPAADKALRDAMGRVEGPLLVGVINSIAYRRDAQAVDGLIKRLGDTDVDVVIASAVALGRIGGTRAAEALVKALGEAPVKAWSGVAEGCILCAERLSADGKSTEAVRLYDLVRRANVPKQRVLEATRGAIVARGSDGIPLLVEELKSADAERFGMALHVARELGGREVTTALATELESLGPKRQPLLVLALADRTDTAAVPVIVDIAGRKEASTDSRIVAVKALERLGDLSSVSVLVDAAAEGNAELSEAAKVSLLRLSGKGVDADLLARLQEATGRVRRVLIELAAARRIDAALPAIVRSTQDANTGIRRAAIQAIGELGGAAEVSELVKLLTKTSGRGERSDIEKALRDVSGRGGVDCVEHLLPLMDNADAALRIVGLHALVIAGGSDALAAVKGAVDDSDPSVQDEAVRVLSTWPNNWPHDSEAAEVLMSLAQSGEKTMHKLLGLRGYLQYVRGDSQLSAQDKVAKVRAVLPLIERREEKRLAIAVLGTIPAGDAMSLLTGLADDSAVTEEACSAILNLAGKDTAGVSKDQRREAIRLVIDKSKNDTTKKRAQELLKRI